MENIIENWRLFMKEWSKTNTLSQQTAFEMGVPERAGQILKPDFYDFMEWLSKSHTTPTT